MSTDGSIKAMALPGGSVGSSNWKIQVRRGRLFNRHVLVLEGSPQLEIACSLIHSTSSWSARLRKLLSPWSWFARTQQLTIPQVSQGSVTISVKASVLAKHLGICRGSTLPKEGSVILDQLTCAAQVARVLHRLDTLNPVIALGGGDADASEGSNSVTCDELLSIEELLERATFIVDKPLHHADDVRRRVDRWSKSLGDRTYCIELARSTPFSADESSLMILSREAALIQALNSERGITRRHVGVLPYMFKVGVLQSSSVAGEHTYGYLMPSYTTDAKSLLSKEAPSPREAQAIAGQLIKGFDHFYQRGIVHRDIKLKNLLLRQEYASPASSFKDDISAAAAEPSARRRVSSKSNITADLGGLSKAMCRETFRRRILHLLAEPDKKHERYVKHLPKDFRLERTVEEKVRSILSMRGGVPLDFGHQTIEEMQRRLMEYYTRDQYFDDEIYQDELERMIDDLWWIQVAADLRNLACSLERIILGRAESFKKIDKRLRERIQRLGECFSTEQIHALEAARQAQGDNVVDLIDRLRLCFS